MKWAKKSIELLREKVFEEKYVSKALSALKTSLLSCGQGLSRWMDFLKREMEAIQKGPGKKNVFLRVAFFFRSLFIILPRWAFQGIDILGPGKTIMALGLLSIALIHGAFRVLYPGDREVQEVYEEFLSVKPRPSYYKRNEKGLKIRNVSIPIFIESVNSYKTMKADIILVPSNKYIKEFFHRNDHLVQDTLGSKIEPMNAEFILQDDGKRVLREKIKKEINLLIGRLQIKGEVQFVYLHYLFAG